MKSEESGDVHGSERHLTVSKNDLQARECKSCELALIAGRQLLVNPPENTVTNALTLYLQFRDIIS